MIKRIISLKYSDYEAILKTTSKVIIFLTTVALLGPFLIYNLNEISIQDKIYTNVEDLPEKKVAIVFGAAVWNNDKPSHVLRDRILTAVQLYKQDKVQKIIMSGDNRFTDYDEPTAMINYAQERGVMPEDLQADYAGRRTYDTCYRAKNIFGLDEAILVTQNFHLPRAIYTCQSFGIDSIGISSDLTSYVGATAMEIRDVYALTLAVLDVNIIKPGVVLGEKIEL